MLCYCFDLCYGIQWFVLRLLKSVFQNSRQALSFFYFAPECPLSIQRKMWSRLWPQTGCLCSIGLYFTPTPTPLLKVYPSYFLFSIYSICVPLPAFVVYIFSSLSEANLMNSLQSRLWVNTCNLCILDQLATFLLKLCQSGFPIQHLFRPSENIPGMNFNMLTGAL